MPVIGKFSSARSVWMVSQGKEAGPFAVASSWSHERVHLESSGEIEGQDTEELPMLLAA